MTLTDPAGDRWPTTGLWCKICGMPLHPILANRGTHPNCESLAIEYRHLGITRNPETSKPSRGRPVPLVEAIVGNVARATAPVVSKVGNPGNPGPPRDFPKVNAPCPACGQPSHWANAVNDYLHPECEPETSPTTSTRSN